MKTNNKGFSLVELIVVIAIMAILAAVAIPTFATFIGKAQQASDCDFMAQAKTAVELAYATDADFDSTNFAVTLKDGKASQVTCGGEVIKATYKGQTVGTKVGDVELTQKMIDAANVIDWNYEFKSVKADGDYVVDETAKEIKSAP